eukprot:1161867-Pelagomonas_calceolata.AAC.1
MKLPGWSCAAPYFITSSHTAEYPMRGGSRARSDQDSIRAAGVALSLIRNAGVKEAWRYNTIINLLENMQDEYTGYKYIWRSQT